MIYMIESHKRSVVKTATFRGLIVLASTVITYGITNDIEQTTFISIIFNITATAMYYVHERLWNRISWGKENEETEKREEAQ